MTTDPARPIPVAWGVWAVWAAAAAAAAVFVARYAVGREQGLERRRAFAAAAADISAGSPPSRLLARGQRALFPFPEDGGGSFRPALAEGLATLRRHEVGVFARLSTAPPETPARRVRLADAAGEESPGVWTLHAPARLAGMTLSLPPGARRDGTTVVWWRAAGEPFAPALRYSHWWMDDAGETRFWLEGEVAATRVESAGPAAAAGPPEIALMFEGDAP